MEYGDEITGAGRDLPPDQVGRAPTGHDLRQEPVGGAGVGAVLDELEIARERRAEGQAPVGVVVLWCPHPDSERDNWRAVKTGLRDLVLPSREPQPDRMGDPSRPVAIVYVPWCRDERRLRAELAALWESAGLLALYEIAPDPSGVEAATTEIRRVFDAFPTARLARAQPTLSVSDVVPFRAFTLLHPDDRLRLVKTSLGPVLSRASAEKWMLPTLRALFDAVAWTFDGLAAHLDVSVNGLRKRLANLSSLTGVELSRRHSYSAVPFDIRMTLHVYDLFGHEMPPLGDERWGTEDGAESRS
jgi:hypothetical protein